MEDFFRNASAETRYLMLRVLLSGSLTGCHLKAPELCVPASRRVCLCRLLVISIDAIGESLTLLPQYPLERDGAEAGDRVEDDLLLGIRERRFLAGDAHDADDVFLVTHRYI